METQYAVYQSGYGILAVANCPNLACKLAELSGGDETAIERSTVRGETHGAIYVAQISPELASEVAQNGGDLTRHWGYNRESDQIDFID